MENQKPQNLERQRINKERLDRLSRLIDGQFTVKRTSGQLETGWRIGNLATDKNNQLLTEIYKHQDGQVFSKLVRASDLLSWQPEPEVDEADVETMPRSELQAQIATEAADAPEAKETVEFEPVEEGIGQEALEASGVDKPKRPEVKLKPGDMARAAEQIGRIIGGETGKGNAVAQVLEQLGQDPSQIGQILNPNTGDPEARQALLLALEREIDYLGEARKLPERVQDNQPNDEKHSVRGFGHDRDKYPPREYAARLALAMLDGSFDYEAARLDYHDDLPADHPHNGQHRQAARMALEASYRSETVEEDAVPVENERLKNFLYGLKGTLPTSIDSMAFISNAVLNQLREDLYRDVVDTDTLARDAIELTTRIEAALSQLSTDNFNLRAIIDQNPEMTPTDRALIQQAEAELSNIVAQLDNMRNDEVYYRLQATIHNADHMNLVALRGNLSNGSLDVLDHNIQTLRARLEALSQIQR